MLSNLWPKGGTQLFLPPEADHEMEADTASTGILHTLVIKMQMKFWLCITSAL